MKVLIIASLLAAISPWPVMAQTSVPTSPSPSTQATSSDDGQSSSARISTMTDSGGLRASRIVGSEVYNEHDEKVGSIDDLIIGNDKSLKVVLSVGGFLGIGSKMVVVPFDKLQFSEAKGNGGNRIILPGVNKGSLVEMPDYHYLDHG